MTNRTHRILIVDDDRLNVDLLEQQLGDFGFETQAAFGGREGLEMVAAEAPDLILLDVMMPDIDGITVCRILKEDPATQLIPIVIMTALDAIEDRVRGIEAGADDFLTKPVNDRELLARINTALKSKQAVDAAVGELESASEQLDRLGSHREDLSMLVVELRPESEHPGSGEVLSFLRQRYRASFEDLINNFSGDVVQSREDLISAAMRAGEHPRLAYEAAQAIRAETEVLNRTNSTHQLQVAIAVSTGNASVGSARISEGPNPKWTLAVEGKVVDETLGRAAAAKVGEIALSEATRARLGEGLDSAIEAHETDEAAGPQTGLPWPAEYRDLQTSLIEDWGIEDLYLHRVLSGKSGALVYAVDLTTRDYRGQAILKLTDHGSQTYDEQDETIRHQKAFDSNPEFAEQHLPRIVHTATRGQQSALLSTIAARGLEYSLPWAHCAYDVQVESGVRLSRELLEAWNASYSFAEGVIYPSELLNDWLDYRTRPEDGGRIHSLLSDECGLDPETPTFLFEGHWYPNPLAFAVSVPPSHQKLSLRAMRGNRHGDLHGYNLLISSEAEPHPYYVIDLADFRPDSFLLFDQGYFELSHLLIQRGAVELVDWISMLDAIDRGSSPRADDLGLVQLVGSLRREVAAWIDRHEPNRLSYLDSQARLGRIAAGLNFSHKRMDAFARLHGLMYAAHTLKSYLKFQNTEWPRDGQVLRLSD